MSDGDPLRRRKSRPSEVDYDDIAERSTFFRLKDQDSEGEFFDRLIDDEVVEAIEALPEEFRTTLVLSDLEGLSYEEIAEQLGIPVGTVKSRLFRGLAGVRVSGPGGGRGGEGANSLPRPRVRAVLSLLQLGARLPGDGEGEGLRSAPEPGAEGEGAGAAGRGFLSPPGSSYRSEPPDPPPSFLFPDFFDRSRRCCTRWIVRPRPEGGSGRPAASGLLDPAPG